MPVINRPIGPRSTAVTIVTEGNGAYGIFAQCLGGGGGNSSRSCRFTPWPAQDSARPGSISAMPAARANIRRYVSVDNGGLIDTGGEGAHGILAQSIGGGGGNGGSSWPATSLIVLRLPLR